MDPRYIDHTIGNTINASLFTPIDSYSLQKVNPDQRTLADRLKGLMPLLNQGGAIAAHPLIQLLGGFLGSRSQQKREISSAREQMRFQEYMSNTAYQRAMADMRKAGLNPILAYKQGGAKVTAGSKITAYNHALQASQVQQASASARSALANAKAAETNNAWIDRYNKTNPDSPISMALLQYKPSNIFWTKMLEEIDVFKLMQEAGIDQKNTTQVMRFFMDMIKWISGADSGDQK